MEMHLPVDQSMTPWIHDPAIFEKNEGDRTEMREVVKQDFKTIKLDNLVPPIHFGLGEAEITENYLKLLRDVLDSMRDRTNVRLHFIGHADSLLLKGDLIELYGDNVGLSRERAGTVAEYCQRALNLSSGSGCVTSADKDEKEAVSSLSHLDPAGFGYHLPQQTGVGFKNFPVSGTKSLNKPSGTFDVCKDESHSPRR